MKVAILIDDIKDNAKRWIISCSKMNLEYKVFNLLSNSSVEQINDYSPCFCLVKPPGDILKNKLKFDEKLRQLEQKQYSCYPGSSEVVLHENKVALSSFLIKNRIRHPQTFIIDSTEHLEKEINKISMPIVAKTAIGASGSGVQIIQTKEELNNYKSQVFEKGVKRKFGPNKKNGGFSHWITKAIKSPKYFFKRLRVYSRAFKEKQKGVLILQEYIEHNYEWRCVKIGNPYFGYKKMNINGKASGSKMFEYGEVPESLLNFTKSICERFNFNFMAIDFFENKNEYLVNEMQTIFGHKNPFICKVNDKVGRYIFLNGNWIFEEGNFNTNESYDLRLETAIKLYNSQKNQS